MYSKSISSSDIEDIISQIDLEKDGYSLTASKEEIMSTAFAVPFYKMIDFAIFDGKKNKFGGYGGYSQNYSLNSSELNFLLKNKEIFDFAWATFPIDDKKCLIERFINVYTKNFLSTIKSNLYIGGKNKEDSSFLLFEKIKKGSESEVGKTLIQIKNFFHAMEKKFPGKHLDSEESIALSAEKIVVFIINGTFYENVNCKHLYDLCLDRLKNPSIVNDYNHKQKVIQDIDFISNLNLLTSRDPYIINSEWNRLNKGEGYLARRKSMLELIMRNGIPTPLITNDISSQGFDSLKISYIENFKKISIDEEREEVVIDYLTSVMTSLKSFETIGSGTRDNGSVVIKFMLQKKPSIAIPLLSSAKNNKLCQSLLKNHFDNM